MENKKIYLTPEAMEKRERFLDAEEEYYSLKYAQETNKINDPVYMAEYEKFHKRNRPPKKQYTVTLKHKYTTILDKIMGITAVLDGEFLGVDDLVNLALEKGLNELLQKQSNRFTRH